MTLWFGVQRTTPGSQHGIIDLPWAKGAGNVGGNQRSGATKEKGQICTLLSDRIERKFRDSDLGESPEVRSRIR